MFAHEGVFIVFHFSNDFNLHSRSHLGSFFLDEIYFIVFSLRPFSGLSSSIFVSKPYLYLF